MNELTNRSDYAMRLERVFTWLADHLDDTLDLRRLADVACMSPYHFHRIYHAMQGETAAETVRRLRLHRAAVELITGELPVSRIARRAGYGSPAAIYSGVRFREAAMRWCCTSARTRSSLARTRGCTALGWHRVGRRWPTRRAWRSI